MFLHVLDRTSVKRRNYKNLAIVIGLVILFLIGFFTIKRRSYTYIERSVILDQLAEQAAVNYVANQSQSIYNLLWGLEMDYLNANLYSEGEPVRDVLLIINTFFGIADDTNNADSWWVVLYSVFVYGIFVWNLIGVCLWIDQKIDLWLDDRKMYTQLGTQDQFRDFVLEYRKQLRRKQLTGETIEIRSYNSTKYDISKGFGSLTSDFLVPVKRITPSFVYPTLYATTVFLLTALHTLLMEPNVFAINLTMVTSYTSGLGSSFLTLGNDFKNYVFVAIGVVAQIFLCCTMWRISQLVVELYRFVIGDEDDIAPVYLKPILERKNDEAKAENDHRKTE